MCVFTIVLMLELCCCSNLEDVLNKCVKYICRVVWASLRQNFNIGMCENSRLSSFLTVHDKLAYITYN